MPAEEGTLRIIKSAVLTDADRAALDGAAVFDPDILDAAIIGVIANRAGELVAVYSYDGLVDCYAEAYRVDPESAGLGDVEDEDGDLAKTLRHSPSCLSIVDTPGPVGQFPYTWCCWTVRVTCPPVGVEMLMVRIELFMSRSTCLALLAALRQ
jgi:hypothetical protein